MTRRYTRGERKACRGAEEGFRGPERFTDRSWRSAKLSFDHEHSAPLWGANPLACQGCHGCQALIYRLRCRPLVPPAGAAVATHVRPFTPTTPPLPRHGAAGRCLRQSSGVIVRMPFSCTEFYKRCTAAALPSPVSIRIPRRHHAARNALNKTARKCNAQTPHAVTAAISSTECSDRAFVKQNKIPVSKK